MENFIFSLNATMPIFIVMVLGKIFNKIGLTNDNFAKISDKFVFNVCLPVMVFLDISQTDIRADFDIRFVLFCILSIIIYMCKMKKIYIFFIIAVVCGFIQINFLETQFETKYSNVEDIKIKAIVISDLREKEYKYSCTIKVQEINGNKE